MFCANFEALLATIAKEKGRIGIRFTVFSTKPNQGTRYSSHFEIPSLLFFICITFSHDDERYLMINFEKRFHILFSFPQKWHVCCFFRNLIFCNKYALDIVLGVCKKVVCASDFGAMEGRQYVMEGTQIDHLLHLTKYLRIE